MENKNSIVLVILLFVAVLCIIFNNQISNIFSSKGKTQQEVSTVVDFRNKPKSYSPMKYNGIYVTGINCAVPLSGKTKEEIYALRKRYVEDSLFANQNYEPSDEVYGQIESGKPWISQNVCKDTETHTMRTSGISEEARFIVNPNILVALEYPFSYSNYPSEEWCADNTVNMVSDGFLYDGDKNEIKVYYKRLPFPTNDDFSFYQFNGLNARDLGYRYAYVDMTKSSFKPVFTDSDNIGNRVIEFQNFLHTGGSCGVDGGCNNGSPRQSYLEFKQASTNYSDSDGVIYIKLWKRYPLSVDSPADIIEKIIIREY